LLANGLQVDLAFAPEAEFAARAPTFRLLFGTAVDRPHTQPPDTEQLIGLAWLYALHVRSAVARGKLWQAEYMVSATRDYVLAAACRRHGIPAVEGRGMDQLPSGVTDPIRDALVRHLDPEEIVRAFSIALHCLLEEIRQTDGPLAARLSPALNELLEDTRTAIAPRPAI
jgi:hypothetical protein